MVARSAKKTLTKLISKLQNNTEINSHKYFAAYGQTEESYRNQIHTQKLVEYAVNQAAQKRFDGSKLQGCL